LIVSTAINEGAPVADEVVEKFRPTGGRILGVLALVMVAAVVVIDLVDREHPFPPEVVWGSLFFGSLVWAAMLRPRLWVTTSDLVMRNMASTVRIPLAAIEQIAVRQVVVVRAGEERFVSPAVGKSWRQTAFNRSGRRESKPGAVRPSVPVATPYPDFVDDRLHEVTEEARAKAGITLLSDEQLALAAGVRREWAWLEIALMVGTGLGFVLSFLV
jgi:hypothetical protein